MTDRPMPRARLPRARALVITRALLAALAAVPLVLATTAGPALADCQPALPLEKAIESSEVVFVGTVTSVEGKSSWATVEVTEVWRGPDLEKTVQIRGSVPAGEFGEDDRVLDAGAAYLFVPWIVDGAFVESICTATAPWTPEFERFRPLDARSPIGGSATGPGSTAGPFDWLAPWIGPVAAALGLGAVALAVAFVAARRRDP